MEYTQGRKSIWNGKESIEIIIPELKRVALLTFIEVLCLGLSVVTLALSVMVFFLSFGFERSDIGSIIFAGTVLVAFLIVVGIADGKRTRTVKIVDDKFNNAISAKLGLTPIDNATVGMKKAGYMYLTDGMNVSMWEIFYYPDENDRITLEKYIPESMRETSTKDPSRAA